MDNTHNNDLLTAFKNLLADNNSQAARLEECAKIIESRDKEIDMLQTMLSEADEYRSSLDIQLKELKDLQRYIDDLQQQAAGSAHLATGGKKQVGVAVSLELQLQNLRMEYTYLQSQLTDLQTQAQELNKRNLLLQQQTSRIAELESLLENAEQEISKRKGNTNLPE
jgi:chromosome segregation ATPase